MSKSYSPTWRLISVIVLRPLIHLLVRNKLSGRQNIPRTGGVILAPNHLSYADWGTDAQFCYEAGGRYPVFLIKASAFEIKGIGAFLRKAGQLPVHRGRADAGLVLKEAENALAEGAAVIPVAHWGTQEILPYGSKKVRLFPRKTVRTVAGPPVDLSRWAGQRMSASMLRAATAAIMVEVTALVGELRGKEPPAVPFDPNLASRTDGIAPPALSPQPGEVASADGAGNPGSATPPRC